MVSLSSNMRVVLSLSQYSKQMKCECGCNFDTNTQTMQNMIYNQDGVPAAFCPTCEAVHDDPEIIETFLGFAMYVTVNVVSKDRKSLEPMRKLAAIGKYHNMTDWTARRVFDIPMNYDYQKIEVVKLTAEQFEKLYKEEKEKKVLEGFAMLLQALGPIGD